jgi:hypothetical protein
MKIELVQHHIQGMIITTDLILHEIGVDNGRPVEPITVFMSLCLILPT